MGEVTKTHADLCVPLTYHNSGYVYFSAAPTKEDITVLIEHLVLVRSRIKELGTEEPSKRKQKPEPKPSTLPKALARKRASPLNKGQVEEIRMLWEQGWGAPDIAERIGVKTSTVNHWLFVRLKVARKPRKVRPSKIMRIVEDLTGGPKEKRHG